MNLKLIKSFAKDFPFDETDAFWNVTYKTQPPSAPTDTHHATARLIIAYLRATGITQDAFNVSDFTEQDRKILVNDIAHILRDASTAGTPPA